MDRLPRPSVGGGLYRAGHGTDPAVGQSGRPVGAIPARSRGRSPRQGTGYAAPGRRGRMGFGSGVSGSMVEGARTLGRLSPVVQAKRRAGGSGGSIRPRVGLLQGTRGASRSRAGLRTHAPVGPERIRHCRVWRGFVVRRWARNATRFGKVETMDTTGRGQGAEEARKKLKSLDMASTTGAVEHATVMRAAKRSNVRGRAGDELCKGRFSRGWRGGTRHRTDRRLVPARAAPRTAGAVRLRAAADRGGDIKSKRRDRRGARSDCAAAQDYEKGSIPRYVGMVWALPPRDTLSGMAGRRVR